MIEEIDTIEADFTGLTIIVKDKRGFKLWERRYRSRADLDIRLKEIAFKLEERDRKRD